MDELRRKMLETIEALREVDRLKSIAELPREMVLADPEEWSAGLRWPVEFHCPEGRA